MLFIFSLWSCTVVHFLFHCGFVPLYEARFGTKQCRALTRTKEVAWHPSNRYGVGSGDWPLACTEIYLLCHWTCALHTTRPLLRPSCIIRMGYTLFSIEYEMYASHTVMFRFIVQQLQDDCVTHSEFKKCTVFQSSNRNLFGWTRNDVGTWADSESFLSFSSSSKLSQVFL